jgi:hypothetical protein
MPQTYHQRFKTLEERFWEKANKSDGCWNWTASVNSCGRATFDSKSAPRMAYKLAKGDVPRNMHVCHTCDNPRCVNPDHLFLGTQQDNVRDAIRKGRNQAGERHYYAKLTETDVSDIRWLSSFGLTHAEIGRAYRVSGVNVGQIVRGKLWSSV